jgi:hypothetical protein
MWRKKAGKLSNNFGGNFKAPYYAQNEEQCKFKVKLNDYWTNLHKN